MEDSVEGTCNALFCTVRFIVNHGLLFQGNVQQWLTGSSATIRKEKRKKQNKNKIVQKTYMRDRFDPKGTLVGSST